MGFWNSITGRSTAPRRNLDALFALPDAAITLQTAMDLTPTGKGAVCYRAAQGPAFAEVERQLVELLDADDDPDVIREPDAFGFTWLIAQQEETSALVTDLHTVNTSLQDAGFGTGLLCSAVAFASHGTPRLALVYRYSTGTIYPFAPTDESRQQRDTLLEMQVRTQLAGDLPLEPNLDNWMPLWGCPVLR